MQSIFAPCEYVQSFGSNFVKFDWCARKSITHSRTFELKFTNHFAGDGLLGGQMGPLVLSRNFADIDSFLKGTGSTNLVSPQPEIRPQLKELDSLSIMDRIPVIIPAPLRHIKDQRPLLN